MIFQSGRKQDSIDGGLRLSIESNHKNRVGRRRTVIKHPAELLMSVQNPYCLIEMFGEKMYYPFSKECPLQLVKYMKVL